MDEFGRAAGITLSKVSLLKESDALAAGSGIERKMGHAKWGQTRMALT
jgi:hypothetical protein